MRPRRYRPGHQRHHDRQCELSGFPTAGSSAVPGTILGGVDALQATSGPGAFPVENTFVQALTGGSGTRGDGLITGPLASGATSNLIAEGNLLLSGGSAGSSAGSSTTVSASFTALTNLTVTLSATAVYNLIASVGTLGDSASAQVSGTYSITDLTTGQDVAICDMQPSIPVCANNSGRTGGREPVCFDEPDHILPKRLVDCDL